LRSLKSRFSGYETSLRRFALITALYAAPAWIILTPAHIVDVDAWWHLRTGQWIVQHRWVPYADWFSSYGMGKPWAAYSWLFEILIYGLFSWLGLIGLLLYVYGSVLAITGALHSLVRKLEPRVANSVAITALAILAMSRLWTPRPWLFTILLFIIELNVLIGVRRSRNFRMLWVLPPLFALWANLHIQFVYGLFVLGVAALEDPTNRLLGREIAIDEGRDQSLPFGRMVVIIIACLIATLINPYHFKIYYWLFDTVRQAELYELITELAAMRFRSLPHWLVLSLTLGAAFVLGRAKRVNTFWGLMLLAGAFLSFRSSRDVWLVTIVSAAIISNARTDVDSNVHEGITKGQVALIVLATSSLLAITIRVYGLSNARLQKAIEQNFPVAAADTIQTRGYPGPLYNHFNWGGFLIWHLPNLPVSIDSRANVHDANRVRRTFQTWKGESNWASDPDLATARLIVARKDFALTQLLRLDSRFELIYEDDVAAVFIAKDR